MPDYPLQNGLTPFFSCALKSDGRMRRLLLVRSEFEDAVAAQGVEDAERLLANGFVPRMDGFFERNTCPTCTVCLPIRLPLALFEQNSEHRRIMRKNENLKVIYRQGLPDYRRGGTANRVLKLLMKYSHWRFPQRAQKIEDASGRKVAAFNPRTYVGGFNNLGGLKPLHIELRDPETDASVGYIIFNVGKKAAYGSTFFYDPEYRATGIGHFLVLKAIEQLKKDYSEIQHLYLANWSKQDSDYSWKVKYPPVEMLVNGQWTEPMNMPAIRQMRDQGSDAFPKRRALSNP